MTAVCSYFQVHQPHRIKRFSAFDIGNGGPYFNDTGEGKLNNQKILNKVGEKCYLPTNALLLDLLKRYPDFRISFSFSGVVLEQMETFSPYILESFQKLVATGQVEILSETYYHSLASIYSPKEFRHQVALHQEKIKHLFGYTPRVFRNTELIYHNDIADLVSRMGYRGILAEGADHMLGWRSPNYLYRPVNAPTLRLLLKNYRFSDDIAFRFGSRDWSEYPLTAEKFAHWIGATNGSADVVNLFMDYETFGEHQWEDTGIFHFLRALPEELLKHPDNSFVTPTDAINRFPARAALDVPYYVSWADIERDLSAWRSNELQHDALRAVYALEQAAYESNDPSILEDWRRMQTSDHFYYMCTKWFADGDVHKYFNPYESPYDAFISYMNALNDLEHRILRNQKERGIFSQLKKIINKLTYAYGH